VARVNGVPLLSHRLEAALNTLIPLESYHRVVDPAKMSELRRRALDQIIDEELQHLEGQRLGIVIPPSKVEKEVASTQKKYGTRAALAAALAKSGATMRDLRLELQRRLVIDEALRRSVTMKCQVTPQEAEAFFASNPDRFVIPEQLHLYGITFGVEPSASPAQWADARRRAEDVRQQIAAGASFQEMARTHSSDPSRASGGDMGLLHRGAMTDEFERATRDLPVGRPSAVVQSIYGYHVVEITDIRPPQRQTFAAVASDIQRDLTTQRCASLKSSWIAGLRARGTIEVVGQGA
jgi:peptidyl-prolyl cis-trans isomerase C